MKRTLTKLLLLCSILSFPVLSSAQTNIQTVSGTITEEESKEPVIGATVIALPSGRGTLTDFDGKFTLEVAGDDSIQVSYIGYQTILLPIDRNSYNISMLTDAQMLEEIVVIGYGTVKKSDLTGSVASIKSEEITKVPSANPLQSLQGKVAGLQILSSSGDPGADPVVRLRGITTLNNNNPIAVIDGVITDIGAISLLNANDIESIEVLKDASASAIYGSRGAAGVVIVTTKKGVSGQSRVSFSIERSIESIAQKIDVMNGREFATYINEINPGTYNNLDVLPDINWQDEIFQDNVPITNANFSLSGGGDQFNYYFGLGYYGQEGVLPKSALDRITAKMNSAYKITSNVRLGLDLSVLLSEKENAPGVINSALWAWPINEPYLADGATFAEVNGGNPIAAIEFTNSKSKRIRSLGNLFLDIDFLEYFTFRSSLQFDFNSGESKTFSPKYFVGPLQQNEENDLSYSNSYNSSLIFENTISYNRDFGVHTINALVGYTAQDAQSEFLNGSTEGLLREDELFWYLDAGQDEFERVGNNFSRSTLVSYLGRANYVYDSRYLLTASFRRDGSSKFGPNNRFGIFPSFAVGWNFHNESFFNSEGIINRAKFRASWGLIGNERIDGNAQYALIRPGTNAVFGDDESIVPGATFSGGGNPNLKWEETEQFNIGVDLGFLEDKITAEVDYYVKNTNDILVALEPIGYTGIGSFRSIVFNAANVSNTGIEWNISYRDRKGDFSYQFGILGTTVSNEVTDIGESLGADSLLVGGDLGNGQQVARTAVGQPIGYFYGYQVEGVFQNQAELDGSPTLFGQQVGDLRYKDINNDGILNAQDRTIIGNSIPDLIYGFSFSLGYKDFTLSGDIQGQLGSDIYNGKQAIRFTTLNFEEKYNNYWDGEGSTNEHPRPTLGGVNFIPSSYYIEDGSFLRLRSLTLNYQMPASVLDRIKLARGNIYVRGTNLWTLTEFTGYSPEIGAGSAIDGVIDRGVYPVTRVITLGLNASF